MVSSALRPLFRATLSIGLAVLLVGCSSGSMGTCACIDYTHFSVDYVESLAEVERAPPADSIYGDTSLEMSDDSTASVYTDNLFTGTFDLYKNRLRLSLYNQRPDSLRLSIAKAKFIHEDARWPLSVMRRADPSASYDTSAHSDTIVGLTIPPGDTVSTRLVPEIAEKNRFEAILPPKKLRFPGYDDLRSVPDSTMRQAAHQLQQRFGTPFGLVLPIIANETTYQYTLSFEVREAIIYGVSQNATVRSTSSDSLVISRDVRDS